MWMLGGNVFTFVNQVIAEKSILIKCFEHCELFCNNLFAVFDMLSV